MVEAHDLVDRDQLLTWLDIGRRRLGIGTPIRLRGTLLWVADAVAWSYGAQGNWRSRVNEILEYVRDVDQP